jgi:hypothetical protein
MSNHINQDEQLESVFINNGWQQLPASQAKLIKAAKLKKRIADLQLKLDALVGNQKTIGKKFEW